MLGFVDNVPKYKSKKRIGIKLGFGENVRKYNGKKTFRNKVCLLDNVGTITVKTFKDKAWVLGHGRMM